MPQVNCTMNLAAAEGACTGPGCANFYGTGSGMPATLPAHAVLWSATSSNWFPSCVSGATLTLNISSALNGSWTESSVVCGVYDCNDEVKKWWGGLELFVFGSGMGSCQCNSSACKFVVEMDECREFDQPCEQGAPAKCVLVMGSVSILASILLRLYTDRLREHSQSLLPSDRTDARCGAARFGLPTATPAHLLRIARLCLVKWAVKMIWVAAVTIETCFAVAMGCRDGWRYFECFSALLVGVVWGTDWWYRARYYHLIARRVAHGSPYIRPPPILCCCDWRAFADGEMGPSDTT